MSFSIITKHIVTLRMQIYHFTSEVLPEVLPSHHFSNLEILPVVVRHLNFKFCIAAFYRPPNSPSSIFDTLSSFITSLSIPQFSNFILLGDFNVNLSNPSHPLYPKFCTLADVLVYPRL